MLPYIFASLSQPTFIFICRQTKVSLCWNKKKNAVEKINSIQDQGENSCMCRHSKGVRHLKYIILPNTVGEGSLECTRMRAARAKEKKERVDFLTPNPNDTWAAKFKPSVIRHVPSYIITKQSGISNYGLWKSAITPKQGKISRQKYASLRQTVFLCGTRGHASFALMSDIISVLYYCLSLWEQSNGPF